MTRSPLRVWAREISVRGKWEIPLQAGRAPGGEYESYAICVCHKGMVIG